MPNRTLPSWVTRRPRGPLGALMVMLLPLLVLNSCASTPPPANSALSGHWQLDPKASDDEHALVTQAVNHAQQQMRRRFRAAGGPGASAGGPGGPDSPGGPGGAGPDGPGGPGGSGGDAGQDNQDQTFESAGDLLGNGLRVGPDFRGLRTRLLQALATPHRLFLQVQSDAVAIQFDSLPPRDYQTGEGITEFNEYGTARLEPHWSGQVFEVRQRYTSGARLVERYEVGPGGALVYTRLLQDPTVGKLTVRGVYRRS